MRKRVVEVVTIAAASAVLSLIGFAALLDADDAKPSADPKWKVTKPDKSKRREAADNSYCLVCHVNLEDEKLVHIHRRKGIGCETCHGFSDEHSADEDNLTAPDIMWSKARIIPRCLTCHSKSKLLSDHDGGRSHKRILTAWEDPATALDEDDDRYCTDCHGDHHIHNRTRQWDKETGKLLKQSGGPAMDR